MKFWILLFTTHTLDGKIHRKCSIIVLISCCVTFKLKCDYLLNLKAYSKLTNNYFNKVINCAYLPLDLLLEGALGIRKHPGEREVGYSTQKFHSVR